MKHFLFICLLSLVKASAFAQPDNKISGDTVFKKPAYLISPHDSIAYIGGLSYDRYVQAYFSKHFEKELDTLGLFGVSWTKFDLDEKGRVKNVASDPSTHPKIAGFINRMLVETSGHWKLNGSKRTYIKNATIVLPVQYTLQRDGNVKYASATELRDLNHFLTQNEQKQLYFLPTVEYISPFLHSYSTTGRSME